MVGSAEEAWEGELSSQEWQLKFQRNISVARGFPLKSVGSKPQVGLPSFQQRSWEETQITSSCDKQQGFCLLGRTAGNAKSLLKGQHTKYCLQPLTLGSSSGRAEWTRYTWSESGAGGCGERTEETATRVSVLSHAQRYCRIHLAPAEHSPPSDICLRKSNSPACRNYSALLCPA